MLPRHDPEELNIQRGWRPVAERLRPSQATGLNGQRLALLSGICQSGSGRCEDRRREERRNPEHHQPGGRMLDASWSQNAENDVVGVPDRMKPWDYGHATVRSGRPGCVQHPARLADECS